MKKFISIIAAAACAATIVSFAACGSDEEDDSSSSSTAIEESGSTGSSVEEDSSGSPAEEETSIPGDIVTAEEWVAAFADENFANVTAERDLYYDYSSLTNDVGSFTSVYYDPDQYRKETQKISATSTAKVDTEYSEVEYTPNNRTYTYENYDGYLSMDSEYSYEGIAEYNHTDVEVLKEALGEDFTDDDYAYWENDDQFLANYYDYTDIRNKTYKDYMQYITEEGSYWSDIYFAEQRTEDEGTEDEVVGDWEYYYNGGDYPTLVLGGRVGYWDPTGGSVPFGGNSNYNGASGLGDEGMYYSSEYDEESGAYVHTYYEDSGIDEDTLMYLNMCGYEYTISGGTTRTYYIKINDGHVSSIKMEYTYTCYFSWTNGVGTYYENTESSSVAEFKFYDYGTTVVEVPEEVEAGLAALKESN